MKDETWFLVRYILEHAADHVWKRNSNCIGLTLAEGVGLSVFDARYCHPDGKLIHSHAYGFTSLIVAGVMWQTRYDQLFPEMAPRPDDIRARCQEFDAEMRPVTAGTTREWLRRGPLGNEGYRAGERYSIAAPELHCAFPEDGTVTLRRRIPPNVGHGVKVFWLDGQPMRAADGGDSVIKVAPDAVDAAILNDIVSAALAKWF